MAETNTTSPASAAAKKAAVTRKTNATKRSTTAKKAAETRAANRGAAARSTTARRTRASATRTETAAARKAADAKQQLKGPVGRMAEIAEKAVYVPVGAALIARDDLVSTYEDLRAKYATRAKARQQMRRFERRGTSAIKGLEKDLREVVTDIETRTGPVVKNVELVSARVENAVQSGRTKATQAGTKVQERIASIA